MGAVSSGVYPVYEHQFSIGTNGRSSVEADYKEIADLATFSISFDDNVDEWTPMTTEGWIRRLKTGKGITISLVGKRNIGDAGNNYVAGLAFLTGQDCNTYLNWTFPDGTVVLFPCVVNITSIGGDSTAVDGLEFDCMSDGKPTVSGGAIILNHFDDFTMDDTTKVTLTAVTTPSDATIGASVNGGSASGADVSVSVSGHNITITSTAGVDGESYIVTVTATKTDYTTATTTFTVTLDSYA
jgi:hypothetical protein